MGIQGFMSFVCSHNDFFHELKLKNTKLIIDGNNLYYKSYFDSGLDLVHGGDYDKLTDVLNKFFESLSLCNIQAYVVFDGGCDISDKKLETQKERIRDKIKMAHNLSEGRAGSVLPLLGREVCLQVLRKLQVPFVQCFSEADREVVVLANLWNCPILSFDSDFCIFDLKAGYCPQNSFQWKNVVTPKGTSECYIPAQCFSAQKLCRYYNNMNIALLPLFAVLMGNDYINLAALETFFNNVHLTVRHTSHGGRRHTRIHGLLNWLSKFADVEEAMENVLRHLRIMDRDSVRQLLYSAMEEYNLDETVNLGQYFLRQLHVSPTAVKLKLPDWVQLALARGEISPLLSDALVLRRVFLHTQVEDFKKPSAHFITKPVRRLIYALLLNASHKSPNEVPRSKEVVEFDRLETSLRRSIVDTSYVYDDISEDISLSKLPQLSLETRLKLLLRGLDLKISDLESVQPSYKLILAIVCYWITHAEPKVKLHHFKALIMGIVCGEAFNIHNKADVHQEPIASVCEQIRRMHEEGGAPEHRSLNLDDVHIFCQWQCCLQTCMHLNNLLCKPLAEPDITRLYSGSLVYHMTQKLKTSPSEDLFKSCPTLEKLYRNCIQAVMSTIPQDHFQSQTKPSEKSKGKVVKKGLNANVGSMLENKPQCDFSNRFADLLMED